jgi:hypothetical protein
MSIDERQRQTTVNVQEKANLIWAIAVNSAIDFSPVYAQTAHLLMDSISSEDDYQGIMKPLKHLSLPTGVSIHVEECKEMWPGDQSKLFVETTEGAYDYQIWDYILADNNNEGIWEAYLLHKLWHSLPMFQHALYSRRTYIYSPEDNSKIECMMDKNSTPMAQSASKKVLVAPQVVKAGNKYFVSCCYWSSFGGLIQEKVEAIFNEHKIEFKDIGHKTLYKYECSIMF